MEFKKALNKKITIYWWNMGKKTLDFKGTYRDYFKKRGIKIRKYIKHPLTKEKNGLRFYNPIGTSIIRFDTFGKMVTTFDLVGAFDDIIKLSLTYLGDKTKFEGAYRTYKLNWR